MLKKISCNIFLQKEIVFHEGLNAIVGDDIASNSIGKSTMLMIIDFVFGGDDYISKNHDVVDNLGHHDFRFIFNFDNKDYYFIRSTNEYKFVEIDDAYSTGSSIMPQKKKYRYREPVQIFQKLLYALQKKIWICWKKPEIKVWQNFWKAICLNRWTEPLE